MKSLYEKTLLGGIEVFSRPLIADPDLVARWKNGEKARCNSCFQCGSPTGIRCILNQT